MKVGIISFAHGHAYSYAKSLTLMKDVELVAVADEDETRGRLAAARFDTLFHKDYMSLLQDDIDAVIICSENARHAEMAVAAAQAQKHILCEKPIATNTEDAWGIIRACETNKVKLQTAFPIRFSPAVNQLKATLDAGGLGKIISIAGTNRGTNPGGWFTDIALSGGGAVLDHTVHVVDLMRWLLQSEVKEVYAEVGTRFTDTSCDDCGLLMLEFDNGVFASQDPSWSRCKSFSTWGDVTMEVVGTQGVIRVDVFAQNVQVFDDRVGTLKENNWGADMDHMLVSSFIEAIRNDTPPVITGIDGLRAMEVALAAYESHRVGHPVRLSQG